MDKQTAIRLVAEANAIHDRCNNIIQQLVEERAWKPMDYGSCYEWWQTEMHRIRPNKPTTLMLMREMRKGGTDMFEAARIIKGAGAKTIRTIAEEEAGVTPDVVSVRSHTRHSPQPGHRVRVLLSPADFRFLKQYASSHHTTTSKLASEWLEGVIDGVRSKGRSGNVG